MKTAADILQEKGSQVFNIGPDASVFQALELMADKNVGALVVLEDQELVGMFSERDYARKVILRGRASKDTPVSDIMSGKVSVVEPDRSVEYCMALMTERRIRHLPVVNDEELVGIISIGDVVKAIISEQEFVIEQLESYISRSSY